MLPFHIDFTHINFGLHAEKSAGHCRGNAMLAGSGFSD